MEFKTITERKLSAKHYGSPRTPAGVSKEVPAPCRGALGTVTADGRGTGRDGKRLITTAPGSAEVTKPHGGDRGEDQGRVIQVSGGNDQGWSWDQPLTGWHGSTGG